MKHIDHTSGEDICVLEIGLNRLFFFVGERGKMNGDICKEVGMDWKRQE